MAALPAVEFGPRQSPIWIARTFGVGSCLGATGMLALAYLTRADGVLVAGFFSIFGICAFAFGGFLLMHAGRMSRLYAKITPSALHLTAHRGRRVWLQQDVGDAVIPWGEIQGFSKTQYLSSGYGTQTTILYTARGDFTFNDTQWRNLDGILSHISAKTGRAAGEIASERAGARSEVQTQVRRMYSLQRTLGIVVVVIAAPLSVLVFVEGVAHGFSADLFRGLVFLVFAAALGIAMVRFYKQK
jgi:hypothetical protein